MKIVEIWESGDSIYTVRFKPNLFKRIFGATEYEEQYKSTGEKYKHGNGGVYIRKDGSELGNDNFIGEAIDNFKRSC